jgi:hypothetical protein
MNAERIEILRMVADKKVTAEEAERLLRALDDGEEKRRTTPRPARFERGGFGLTGLIEDVGSTVQEAVKDALGALGVEDPLRDHEALPIVDGAFAVPAGSTLTVQTRGFHDGDLELVPGEGALCKLPHSDAHRAAAFKSEGGVVLTLSGGARLAVPPGVRALHIALRGGSVRGTGMPCPLQIRTMGGDVSLLQLLHPFEIRTMGGKARLALEPSLTGDSVLATMGGRIEVVVPDSLPLRVEASTMGGKLELDGERLGHEQGGRLHLGPEGAAPQATLLLKSTGGKVKLSRSRP